MWLALATVAFLLGTGCLDNVVTLRQIVGADNPTTTVDDGNGGLPGGGPGGTGANSSSVLPLPIPHLAIYVPGGSRLYPAGAISTSVTGANVSDPARGGDVLTFDASGSVPASDGSPLAAFSWQFGDGATGAGLNVTHSYPGGGGVFVVVLVVTDRAGASATQKVTVAARPALWQEHTSISGTVALGSPADLGVSQAPTVNRDNHTVTIASSHGGETLEPLATTFNLTPTSQGGLVFELDIANGSKVLASRQASQNGAAIGLELDNLPSGPYVASAALREGAQGSYTLSVTTTYQPVNPQVETYLRAQNTMPAMPGMSM
jgi:hypothetical protein